jgi:hypothetical protein
MDVKKIGAGLLGLGVGYPAIMSAQ